MTGARNKKMVDNERSDEVCVCVYVREREREKGGRKNRQAKIENAGVADIECEDETCRSQTPRLVNFVDNTYAGLTIARFSPLTRFLLVFPAPTITVPVGNLLSFMSFHFLRDGFCSRERPFLIRPISLLYRVQRITSIKMSDQYGPITQKRKDLCIYAPIFSKAQRVLSLIFL